MRGFVGIVVLSLLMTAASRVPAFEPEDDSAGKTEAQQQLEALRDLEHAETDEEAEAARQRFDDASRRELDRRRDSIEQLIER